MSRYQLSWAEIGELVVTSYISLYTETERNYFDKLCYTINNEIESQYQCIGNVLTITHPLLQQDQCINLISNFTQIVHDNLNICSDIK